MRIIHETLSKITIGPRTTRSNMTMFALMNGETVEPDFVTLDEAMAAGTALVNEISEGGSVPELRFVNKGDRAVLLLDGEELVGTKQNRALNLTILIPPQTTITIPVSCVEQGRWGYRDRDFTSSDKAQFAEGRARKAMSVSCFMASGHGRQSDQSDVWEAIDEKISRMNVASPTMAMEDVFESARTRLDEYTKAFNATEGQVGALFVINGRVSGMDLFDSHTTLGKLMPKLVLSHALDAVDRSQPASSTITDRVAEEFLGTVSISEVSTHPAVGLGTDIRFQSQFVAGGALTLDDRVVHLCAFPTRIQEREDSGSGGMRSPSGRARNWS